MMSFSYVASPAQRVVLGKTVYSSRIVSTLDDTFVKAGAKVVPEKRQHFVKGVIAPRNPADLRQQRPGLNFGTGPGAGLPPAQP